MTIEAWIGLGSLVVAIVGVAAAVRFRPQPSLAAMHPGLHEEERREALSALHDIENVINDIRWGTPLAHGMPAFTVLSEAVERLGKVAKIAPHLGEIFEDALEEARHLRSVTGSVPDDKEIMYALREWKRTDDPISLYAPGPLLRNIAGKAIRQFNTAKDCHEAVIGAREALTSSKS
ncbi:hypothetical protein ACN263_27330 [Micromonospora sp. WMMD729]|uniref:hypothetical protein n=1 Tax=Micromonospora sp. WMMD729 TaxID=3404127 RepID=UPI003BF4A4B3